MWKGEEKRNINSFNVGKECWAMEKEVTGRNSRVGEAVNVRIIRILLDIKLNLTREYQ